MRNKAECNRVSSNELALPGERGVTGGEAPLSPGEGGLIHISLERQDLRTVSPQRYNKRHLVANRS